MIIWSLPLIDYLKNKWLTNHNLNYKNYEAINKIIAFEIFRPFSNSICVSVSTDDLHFVLKIIEHINILIAFIQINILTCVMHISVEN